MKATNIIAIFLLALLLSSCHVGRYFYWNFADIGDQYRFPSHHIQKAENPFSFEQGKYIAPNHHSITEAKEYDSFEGFLEKTKTLSFIVIRNDSVLYERYFDDFSDTNTIASFSITKSFVAVLMGMAIDDGFVNSVDDYVTDYLPDFKHEGFDKIKIVDVLNMRTGIAYSEAYTNPFGKMAKFYYGTNISKYVYDLKVDAEPDAQFEYQSCNTQILGMIIEKATGKNLAEYVEEKIWSKIGTETDATWNYDSEKHKQIKAYCCLNATPKDFAKFGRLMLHEGSWEGEQMVSPSYFEEIIKIDKDSRDVQDYPYSYQFRVMHSGHFFAKGILGQYVYINPEKNVIIVRMGKKSANVHWAQVFDEISSEL